MRKIIAILNVSTLYETGDKQAILNKLADGKTQALSTNTIQKDRWKNPGNKTRGSLPQKDIPEQVIAHLRAKDKSGHEKALAGENGLIYPNTDIGLIQGIHPKYIIEANQVLKGTRELTKLSKKSETPIGTEADKATHIKPSKFITNKVNLDGSTGGASTIKVLALAKAAHMNLIFGHDNEAYTICFDGHWARLKDIQGDHAYPGSFVIARVYQFFTEDNMIQKKGKNQAIDPREDLHAVMKYSPKAIPQNKPNKAMLLMYYSDAKNLIGLCGSCNASKGDGFIEHLLKNPYYGKDFIMTHFPLDYSTIIPRTKDGQGLGDAMIMHFFTTKTISEGLNLHNIITIHPDDIKLEGTEITKKEAKGAMGTVAVIGELALTLKEQEALKALLQKIHDKLMK